MRFSFFFLPLLLAACGGGTGAAGAIAIDAEPPPDASPPPDTAPPIDSGCAFVPRCEGATRVACIGGTVLSTPCPSIAHCEQGFAASCAVCLDGDHRCEGAELLRCRADRQGWIGIETCASASRCSASPPLCRGGLEICKPGDRRCVGDTLQACADSGESWVHITTCPAGTCNAAGGFCRECKDGERKCSGATVLSCMGGEWGTLSVCPTGTACKDGACVSTACTAGSARCTGKVLETCKDDGSGFVAMKTCPRICDPVGKECDDCASGEASCEGETPLSCDATGHWTKGTPCSGANVCSAGKCVPAGFSGSGLLSIDDGKQINAWIGDKTALWSLCYSTSLHPRAASEFHKRCDGKGPSVTVVGLPTGKIVGGYASQSWQSGTVYFGDEKSFLFSLTNKFKHVAIESTYWLYGGTGPTFGGGHDLTINSFMSGWSCNLGRTYACRVGSFLSAECRNDFCGGYSGFMPLTVEVFVK